MHALYVLKDLLEKSSIQVQTKYAHGNITLLFPTFTISVEKCKISNLQKL